MTRRAQSRRGIGALALTAVTLLFAAAFFQIPQLLLSSGRTTVTAVFTDTATLTAGDPVRVRGVKVGEVSSVDIDEGARSTTVTMKVEDDGMPLYRDARASLRWRTLLGAAFIVDLDPGSSDTGDLQGNRIALSRTTSQVELEDVTRSLRADARTGLRTTLRELPVGLSSDDDLKNSLSVLADISPDLRTAVSSLRGEDGRRLRALVTNTARTVEALDSPQLSRGRHPVQGIVEDAGRTLEVTDLHRAELKRTLQASAPLMDRVQTTLTALNGTLDRADTLVSELDKSAGDVEPTLRQLRPVVTRASRVLKNARPLVADLRPTARSLARTAQSGAPLLQGLQPTLERLSEHILPDLALRSPENKHTTYEMIGPTVAAVNGASSFFDQGGFWVRFPGSGGERAFGDSPCLTFLTDPSAAEKIRCKQLENILASILPAGSARKGG